MVKSRKFKKSEGSSQDMISNLSDDLLSIILSQLSTKELLCTSLLSKRWRNLWLSVPALDLESNKFEYDYDLFEFIDGFMESNEERDIKRFKLIYDPAEHDQSEFELRIHNVMNRRVQHITVISRIDVEEALVTIPCSLYSCGMLVNLTLYGVVLESLKPELVSLPCVKTMHLEAVKLDGTWVLKKLISSCLVLEELVIVTHPDDLLGVVFVRSQSLKSFKLESRREEFGDHSVDPRVQIDSPRLEYMSIRGYKSQTFIIRSISPSAKVNIDVVFDVVYDDPLKRRRIHNFLTGISTVREIIISPRTLKVIKSYSDFEPLSQFSNLSRLDASFVESTLELLPVFLGCCPNLKSLFVEFGCVPETEEIKLSYVPQCFLSSLEFVQMKTAITTTEPWIKMNLANYFIRNCAVMKKLEVSKSFSNIINKIKRIPKRCGECEVVILKPTNKVVSPTSSLLTAYVPLVDFSSRL